MTAIKTYVILTVGCIFLSTLVQTALPDSPLKKTLRFVMGLILGVIIITPFSKTSWYISPLSFTAAPAAVPLSTDRQQQMEHLVLQQTRTLFQQTLEQEIRRVIAEQSSMNPPEIHAVCGDDGEIHTVTVVSRDYTLPALISQKFDIPLQKIHLRAAATE